MQTVRITISNYPFKGDLAYALAQRDDAERHCRPIQIPRMKYYESSLKGASLRAFYHQIKNIMTP